MRRLSRLLAILVAISCTSVATANPVASHLRVLQLKEEFDSHWAASRFEDAQRILQEMAAVDSEHPQVCSIVAYQHRQRRTWDEAEEWMRSHLSTGPCSSYGLARIHYYKEDLAAAEAASRDALGQYRAIGHLAGQAYSLNQLGGLLQIDPKRRDEAVQNYEAARVVFRQLEDSRGEANVLSALGTVERRRKNLDGALSLAREALAIRERLGNQSKQATSWSEIGRTLKAARRLQESADAFERALALSRDYDDSVDQYQVLERLAGVYDSLQDETQVQRCWNEAAEVAEKIGDERRLALARYELGRYRLVRGYPQEAIDPLRLATGADQELGVSAASRAHRVLGQALSRIGHVSAAEDELHVANDLADKIPDERLKRLDKARAVAALAALSHSTGELAQALLYFEEALELWRQVPPFKQEVAEALNDLGMIHWQLGRNDTAGRYLLESLELASEIEDRTMLARAHNNLGQLQTEEGRTSEALDHLEKSIGMRQALDDRGGVAQTRYNLAGLLWKLGRREEATRTLEWSLEGFRAVDDLKNEAGARNRSAEFQFDKGKYDAAMAAFSETIELSREHGLPWPLFEGLIGRAAVHEKTGRIVPALADLEQALDVVESLRNRLVTGELKMRFFASKMAFYERAVVLRAGLDEPQAATAFQWVERARARSLLDSLTESRVTARIGLSADLASQEKQRVDQVSVAAVRLASAKDAATRGQARKQLDDAEERLRSFELEVKRKAPRYSDIVYPEPISLRETQKSVLREGETLLRYFIGDEHAMLWVVDREHARFLRLPPPAEIAALVESYREQAGRETVRLGGVAGESEAERLARALRVADLPAGHRLLVVPDGPLHHLPFDALRTGGRYLVEDHEIVVVPSVTTLSLMRREPGAVARDGFLGVGDPRMPAADPRFPPLPYTRKALDQIANFFAEDERLLLKGEEATKQALRDQPLDRFRYLHFATHGWLDAERPRYFGLQLSPSGEEKEDFLYLDEVFSMKLEAELVVLSACRSGLGEMLQGEGIVGLTRGFLYAGARSLLVSLWDVDDRASAEFMEAFYGEVTAGHSIPDALRRVKLRFLNSKRKAQRQPYQWAPFVLIGDAAQGSTVSKPKVNSGSSSPAP